MGRAHYDQRPYSLETRSQAPNMRAVRRTHLPQSRHKGALRRWALATLLIFVSCALEANCQVTSIVVTSVDHAGAMGGQYFNFDHPDEWDPGQTMAVYQCRDGQQIWSGLIQWWNSNNGGSTGNSHGRRHDGADPNQWRVGDTVSTATCQAPTPASTAAPTAPIWVEVSQGQFCRYGILVAAQSQMTAEVCGAMALQNTGCNPDIVFVEYPTLGNNCYCARAGYDCTVRDSAPTWTIFRRPTPGSPTMQPTTTPTPAPSASPTTAPTLSPSSAPSPRTAPMASPTPAPTAATTFVRLLGVDGTTDSWKVEGLKLYSDSACSASLPVNTATTFYAMKLGADGAQDYTCPCLSNCPCGDLELDLGSCHYFGQSSCTDGGSCPGSACAIMFSIPDGTPLRCIKFWDNTLGSYNRHMDTVSVGYSCDGQQWTTLVVKGLPWRDFLVPAAIDLGRIVPHCATASPTSRPTPPPSPAPTAPETPALTPSPTESPTLLPSESPTASPTEAAHEFMCACLAVPAI